MRGIIHDVMDMDLSRRYGFLLIPAFALLNLQVSVAQKASCTLPFDPVQQISFDSCVSVLPEVIAEGDTIHALWFNEYERGCGSMMGIFYSRSLDSGKTFSPPRQVLSWDSVTSSSGNLTVAGRYLYILYSARVDSPVYYNMGFVRSTDAGDTWNAPRTLGDYWPRAITAHDSSVYIRFSYDDTSGGHHRSVSGCLASHDYGGTFQPSALGLPAYNGNGSTGYGTLMYSANSLHYVYTPSSYAEVLYTRSTDQGRVWSVPETLSVIDGTGSEHPRIGGDETGNIFVIWYDFKYGSIDGYHGTIIMRRSADDGVTWHNEQQLSYMPTAIEPAIGVCNRTVVVAWSEYRDYYNDRVLMRVSYDRGESWCDTVQVDTLGGTAVDCSANPSDAYIAWFQEPSTPGDFPTNINIRRAQLFIPTATVPPPQFSLYQNYPNPFNGPTIIMYDLPTHDPSVSLTAYDLLGREVARLVDHLDQVGGRYKYTWRAEGLASGVYFYRLQTTSTWKTKKLLILR